MSTENLKYEWRGHCILNNDDKFYYQTVESIWDGQIFEIGDCVSLMPEQGKLTYIGRIVALYEHLDSKIVQTTWFYRPEETIYGRQAMDGEKELFFSDEKAENSVTSVIGICFVVTLSQFKKGVEYLKQCNPLIDENNLFYAQKNYDRNTHQIQYLPIYKALSPPINTVQPGMAVEKVIATMRCKNTDKELIFVKWKNRSPIYNSWIEKEINVYDESSFSEIHNISSENIEIDQFEPVEGTSESKRSKLLHTKPNNNNNHVNNNNNNNLNSNGHKNQLEYSPYKNHLNNNNNINNNNNSNGSKNNNTNNSHFEEKDSGTIIHIPSKLITQKQTFSFSSPISNPSPSTATTTTTTTTSMSLKSIISSTPTSTINTPPKYSNEMDIDFSSSVQNGTNNNNNNINNNNYNNNNNNALKLPITIKLMSNNKGRGHKSTGPSHSSQKKTPSSRAHDKWDLNNVVSLTGSVSFVPQERPYDNVNIPQWHVMSNDELMHVPDDEGSSSEETDDDTYGQLHVQAHIQLKAQIAEMIRMTEEKLKLKKVKVTPQKDNDQNEDDTIPGFSPEDF
jgi:hypothetical protein